MANPGGPPQTDAQLGDRLATGAAWVVALRLVMRLIGLLSTVILARLLLPADFGLVALATLIAASLDRLSAFNFTVWLIRHPAPKPAHYDTVWTLVLLRGIFTATALLLMAIPMARFFAEPGLRWVLVALAFGQITNGLKNVGIVDFQKYLRFHKEFQMLLGARIGSFIVTVSCAFWLRSYWALVAGLISSHLLNLILSYTLHSYRPRLSLAHAKVVFDYSKWLLASSLSGFLYGRMDAFFIGKFLASQSLGLYTVAREIADLASSEILMPLRRVMLPGYAQVNQDEARLRSGFIDGFALLLLMGAPISVGIALLADPLVHVLLGEQWLASIPLVQILSLYALSSIIAANQGPILLAMGKAKASAMLVFAGVLLLIPALWWSVTEHGLTGAAVAIGVVNVIVVGLGLAVVLHALKLNIASVLSSIWPTLVAVTAMAFAVHATANLLRESQVSEFVELPVASIAGALVYIGIILGLWLLRGRPKGAEYRLIETVQRWRAK